MRALVVGVVMLGASGAAARPLPKGLTISYRDGSLYASRDGMTVKVLDDAVALRQDINDFHGAELSADGTLVDLHVEKGCTGAATTSVRLASIDARFENLRGMQQHLKKKYDDAIAHFTAAVTADDADLFVTNLLSAQALGKHLDDADATIARYAPKRRAWFAWRLAVDPDLAALHGRASAKPYVAAARSKLALAALDRDAVAVSPLGLVALHEDDMAGGPGAPVDFSLALYTPGNFDEPMRIPAKQAEGTLAAMGFEKRAVTWTDMTSGDARTATSPDKNTTVTVEDARGATVKRGTASVHVEIYDQILRIGFAGDLVLVQVREHLSSCNGDLQQIAFKVVQLR